MLTLPVIVPPTFKLPCMPTPPVTINAPVVVDVLAVVAVNVTVLKVGVDGVLASQDVAEVL
jgi:hypothetical protein